MFKKAVINNHEITRNRGTVKIDGQKTPLRFGEAVKAISNAESMPGCVQWDRAKQKWVPFLGWV